MRTVSSIVGVGVVALALSCSGPGSGSGSASGEGAEAVRRYDDVVIAAYRANDPAHLRDVATAKEARKIAVLVDFKRMSEVALESTLVSLSVKGVERIAEDRLAVTTEERWRYHDRPLRPGVPPGPELLADMHARYDLYREDGTWKVSGVAVPWNQYYDPVTEQPIPRPSFEPQRGEGLVHSAPRDRREAEGAGSGSHGSR